MKHNKVDWNTELRRGDFIFHDGQWVEIYNITTDDGILLSSGPWVCRTELNYDEHRKV